MRVIAQSPDPLARMHTMTIKKVKSGTIDVKVLLAGESELHHFRACIDRLQGIWLLCAFEPSAYGSGYFTVSTWRCGLRRPVIDFCGHLGSGAIKSMLKPQIAQAVQLLDLMLEYFADDGHWTRGRYDDGNGGHCLVCALPHLSREHSLPRAPAITLLQDAMPRPGLLVHFNDRYCGNVAELRSVILKARRLADKDAERERADAAIKTWLLAQIGKQRGAPATAIGKPASAAPFAPERLAA
jgi:hypothetical protein